MLDALPSPARGEQADLRRRIFLAADARQLWDLRGELMNILAAAHGEVQAAQQLALITARFDGLVPSSLLSGPRAPE